MSAPLDEMHASIAIVRPFAIAGEPIQARAERLFVTPGSELEGIVVAAMIRLS